MVTCSVVDHLQASWSEAHFLAIKYTKFAKRMHQLHILKLSLNEALACLADTSFICRSIQKRKCQQLAGPYKKY